MALSRSIRWMAGIVGLLLFAFLVWKVGPDRLLASLMTLGWGFAAIFALGGVSHLLKTAAWRYTFEPAHRDHLPFAWSLGARLAGEGVAMLTFAGQVVGETTRAMLVRSAVPMVNGVSSAVIDRSMFTFTGFLVVLCGFFLAPLVLALPSQERVTGAWVAAILGSLVLVAYLALRFRWPFLTAPASAVVRLLPSEKRRERIAAVGEVQAIIHDFYHGARSRFWASFWLNAAGHGCGVMEVWLALHLLGVEIGLATAFLIEALTKLVNISGALIPGNLGAYEGGNMLILARLGHSGADGIALGLARRLRGMAWAAVGLAFLYAQGMRLRKIAAAATD